MAGLYWHDGVWHAEPPRLTGPADHAFWLGSVVFDGARAIRGATPDLDLHCARAVASARSMLMRPTKTAEEVEALCREAVARFPADAELYIRPQFFVRGGLGAAQPDPDTTDFCLAVYDAPLPPDAGFSSALVPFRRPAPDMAPTDAKAAALYPNSARATAHARARGFDQAVVLDPDGDVAEFATANLMLAKGGVVLTPAANGTFLAGITRARVVALLRGAGVEVREARVTPAMLGEADEIFATGNYGKVQRCARHEGRDLPPGPLSALARRLYFEWADAQRGGAGHGGLRAAA